MESRHIRVDHFDAIESKKHVLHSELHLIQMLKRVKSFRQYRKKELTLKTELKANITFVKNKINELIASMPEPQEMRHEKKVVAKSAKNYTGDKEAKTLQTELEDIKRRLEALQ